LNKAHFCPIATEAGNDNPRNIQYIPPVIISIFFALKQNCTLFKGLYDRRQRFNKSSFKHRRCAL